MIEKLFRFLFKYPPLMFRQADFTWGLSQPLLLVVGAGLALAIAAMLTYRGLSTVQHTAEPCVRAFANTAPPYSRIRRVFASDRVQDNL